MIIREFYKQRKDGVDLYRTFSDNSVYIKKIDSDEKFSEAIDVDGAGFIYYETDEPIITEEEDLTELFLD